MDKDLVNIRTSNTKHIATSTGFDKQLILSLKDYSDYFQNFQDVFFWNTYDAADNKINCVVSPSIKNVLGYTVDEYKRLPIEKRYLNMSERTDFLKKVKTEKFIKNFPLTFKKKDGSIAYIEMDCELITANSEQDKAYGLRGVFKDVTQKVNEQLRREIAFEIAEKSQRRLINLTMLGEYIYKTLKNSIKLSNFYIAVLDEENKQLIFPYFKDKYTKETSFNIPYRKNGFTEFLIKNGNLVIINSQQENKDFLQKNAILTKGKKAENLIAIPLKSDGKTIGVLVAQNYTKKSSIKKEDIKLLKFIATQVAVIIDRKLWQDKLIVNEEYFRSLNKNSSEIIGIINEDGIIEYVSESLYKILKYQPYELIGKNVSNYIKVGSFSKLTTNKRLLSTKIYELLDKNGNTKHLEVSISQNTVNNKNNGIIFNAKDITAKVFADRKIAFAQNRLNTLHAIEKALISNQSLDKILDNAIIAISKNAFDVDRLNICLVNHSAKNIKIIAQLTKYEGNEKFKKSKDISFDDVHFIATILEKKIFKISDLTHYPILKNSDKKILKEGIQAAYIVPIIIHNKVIGTLNLASKTKNYFDSIDTKLVKEITVLLAVVINNAILKDEITQRKNELTNIFNNANEGIIRIDANGKFLDVNQKMMTLLGYSYKDLLTLNILDITHPNDIKKSKEVMSDIKTGKISETTFEKRYLHQSGKILTCKVIAKGVYTATKEFDYFLGFITDISALKKATQQVTELTKAINSSASVIITDCNGKIIEVNDSVYESTGYSKKEIIGQTPRIFSSGIHSKKFYSTLWNTILTGNTWKGEIRNKKKDGTFYWLFTTITPIFNEDGKIEQFLAIRFDITEEKNAKLNLIREVIEAQEKERERFAMEIHDGLGQTLLAAKMNLNAISDSVSELANDDKHIFNNSVKLLTEAIQEARSISHGLMSRVLNKFGLAYAVNEIVANMNASLDLKFNFQHNIEYLRFNEELEMGVYRTLQELIKNIIKHSKATHASLKITKKENDLTILIQDNGIGLTKQTLLNPKSGGIGLKNMKSRIEYLGGQFEIDETIKKGTRITIHISLN